MMSSFLRMSRTSTAGGKCKAADEETLPFQGPAAGLKQNCGKFKAAGDGLQADAVADEGGVLKAFAFRGHSLLLTVSMKGEPASSCRRCTSALSGSSTCPGSRRATSLGWTISTTPWTSLTGSRRARPS